jgi:hypothetical protein
MLSGKLAAGPAGDDLAPEIGIAPEQAKAALHLPFDRHAGVGGWSLAGRLSFDARGKTDAGQQCRSDGR